MLLDMKVTENDCNKHYYSGNLLNKNVITEIKFDPFSTGKNPEKKTNSSIFTFYFFVTSFRIRKLLTSAIGLRSSKASYTGQYYVLYILKPF